MLIITYPLPLKNSASGDGIMIVRRLVRVSPSVWSPTTTHKRVFPDRERETDRDRDRERVREGKRERERDRKRERERQTEKDRRKNTTERNR